jgi:hypothetical protein
MACIRRGGVVLIGGQDHDWAADDRYAGPGQAVTLIVNEHRTPGCARSGGRVMPGRDGIAERRIDDPPGRPDAVLAGEQPPLFGVGRADEPVTRAHAPAGVLTDVQFPRLRQSTRVLLLPITVRDARRSLTARVRPPAVYADPGGGDGDGYR